MPPEHCLLVLPNAVRRGWNGGHPEPSARCGQALVAWPLAAWTTGLRDRGVHAFAVFCILDIYLKCLNIFRYFSGKIEGNPAFKGILGQNTRF